MSGPEIETDLVTFRAVADDASPGSRVPIQTRVSVEDPFAAYRRARGDDVGILLETTGGQKGWGYFAVEPEEVLSARSPATSLVEPESPSLAALAGRLEAEELARGPCEVPFPCGLFGWISYDLARELETLPNSTANDRRLPQLQFGLFDRVAAWREPRTGDETELVLTSCPRVGADPSAAYRRGVDRLEALVDRIRAPATPSQDVTPTDAEAVFRSEIGRQAYADRVRRIKEYIREGDTFQVNVSHRLRAPAAAPPIDVYDALRRVNPAPYSGLLEFPGVDLVSASPELLLAIEDRELLTEPIAGTRPRGETDQADLDFASELTQDEKERAEHAMLVDLERNDLGKVSAYGSVEVEEYRRVDRYSEVMHLVSLVRGRLREDVSLAGVCAANPLEPTDTSGADRLCAAIAAVFPGGTITGAPKPRTMEIIEELEATRRGPYTGSMAMIGFDGRATLNIIIRTLVRWQDEYHLRVGAGIVHDSEPDREYEETLDKARALLFAVDEALADIELEVAG